MASPAPAAPVELPSLDPTLGALYIGVIFATWLFGIATLQSWNYYQNFPSDRWTFKSLVGFLWVADAFHIVCITHAVYWFTITQWGNVNALQFSVWSLDLSTAVTTTITSTCQLFFTMRVWILSRNWIVTALCVILCAVRFSLSLVTTWASFHVKGIAKYEAEFSWSIRAGLGTAAAADATIAIAMVYYLSRNRTGIKSTDRLISRLLTFTVETCLLTSTMTVIDVICFATLSNDIFLALYFQIAKLYTNALLTSLNLRKTWHNQTTGVHSTGTGFRVATQSEGSATLRLGSQTGKSTMQFSRNTNASQMATVGTTTMDFELSDRQTLPDAKADFDNAL
ncbi:hypothetical protein CERSUDRAFT_115713 [Gelatoporia subvermispora B]|uniref:DUF6534 domain-containing protein n=1 Tax=Ceriporiopsis subvermispora (strain B) TaxID=914234 RepID=M2RBH6_CERS8|nr:hypothetical protein CERSUDRAFT_115713 [Gelatoporia subvermispora B]